MAALSAWFWNERFWLPQNVTWADLAETEAGVRYPRVGHFVSIIPLAFGIFALRLLFERFIAKPCALHLGIQTNGPRRPQPNAILEKVFTSITKCPDWKRLEGLSKQLDWDARKIQRWFRHRRNQDKPSMLTKFCESMWRFIFYGSMFSYGMRFLWSTPWFWDTRECWYNYPYQAAKLANYAKYQNLCDALFVLFSFVFVTTRLGIFPFWILNTALFESWALIGPYPSWWLFNGLLLILQVLHVIWSYLIIRIAYKALARGKVGTGKFHPLHVLKDVRSDIESSSEEDETTSNGTKRAHNTSINGANRINGHLPSGQWAEE
uniref:Ceramide synthase 5 isoform X5 n=1 Tax=Geotrypetes seraphini TaxID=260995 RepID=A0A6P8R8D3_GEOSA|nr:ceramide synthase 5 isoform X5 [Geotrypetes seraphini]